MLDAEACLRPGGIIIFMDGDMKSKPTLICYIPLTSLSVYSDDFVSTVPIGLSEAEGGDPIKGSWMYRLARGKQAPMPVAEILNHARQRHA